MKKTFFALSLLAFASTAHSELICKASAHGMDHKYIFTSGEGRDLSVDIKSYLKGSVFDEQSGSAEYASTVKSRFMENSTAESYYVVVGGEGDYTELIGISYDLKSMARSRPDPISDGGNFIRFACTGSL